MIKLNELGIIAEAEVKELKVNNVTVEVKTKLPYEEVFNLIQMTINLAVDDRPFISWPIYEVMKSLVLVHGYTNLDILQPEEGAEAISTYETYDILTNFDIINEVKKLIDPVQLNFFETTLEKTIKSIVEYKNSAVGIVDTISTNAAVTSNEINAGLAQLNNPELGPVRKIIEIMSKEE